MTGFTPQNRYEPRRFSRLDDATQEGWRIKRYAIHEDGETFDGARFGDAERRALDALPAPAVRADRPGAGFLILHQGANVDYAVLGWWDRDNELPLKIWVRERDGSDWRRAEGSESVCVWDLQIIQGERRLYVDLMIAPGRTPDIEAYLTANAI